MLFSFIKNNNKYEKFIDNAYKFLEISEFREICYCEAYIGFLLKYFLKDKLQ